jgi:hypothetical protein
MSTGTVEDTPSWHARATVVQCVIINRERTQRKVEINYVRREAVKLAHIMANISRRKGRSFAGEIQQEILIEMGFQMNWTKNSIPYKLVGMREAFNYDWHLT